VNRALIAIYFSFIFLAFFTPMEIGGFWWHLSTGQWIVDNLRIPDTDPFTVTATGNRDISFVLSAFWLCQSVYALLHSFLGLQGIIVLKAATFALVFFTLVRFNRGTLATYAVSLPAVYVATFYTESRPQTFSFLFFALAIYLLEAGRAAYKERRELPRSLYLLPVLMLLWANIHPGFVIGLPLIGAYLFEALAIAGYGRSSPPVAGFVIIGILSVGISALNPNGLEAVLLTARMLDTTPAIHEHLPLKEFAEFTGGKNLYYALLSLIALGFASFTPRRKRLDLLHLAVFAALSYLSLKTFRAGFFFSIFAVAATGRNLSCLRVPPQLKGKTATLSAAAALLVVMFIVILPRTIIMRPLLAEGIFPEKAVEFIEEKQLPPNIYHPYEWGGYLIWKLYPQYKAFIDSRGIGSVKDYKRVLDAEPGWEKILERHGVNTVLYWPLLPYRADVPPILFELQRHSGWSPVYWDSRSVMFVRSTLAKTPIKKDAVWELMTSLLIIRIQQFPADPDNYNSLGEIYARSGRRALAAEEFRKALSMDPENIRAARNLQSLQQ
jgi:hypothetical protein